jgi:hypothetical protein
VADREDQADPPGQPGRLRRAADPRRAAPGARDPRLPQARRAADANGRYLGACAPQARPDDDPRAGREGGRRPGRAALPAAGAERALARRHHLPQNVGGLALPSGRPGRLLEGDRRLVDGGAHASPTRCRRARDGARQAAPRARADPPLRSGQPARTQPVVATVCPGDQPTDCRRRCVGAFHRDSIGAMRLASRRVARRAGRSGGSRVRASRSTRREARFRRPSSHTRRALRQAFASRGSFSDGC